MFVHKKRIKRQSTKLATVKFCEVAKLLLKLPKMVENTNLKLVDPFVSESQFFSLLSKFKNTILFTNGQCKKTRRMKKQE